MNEIKIISTANAGMLIDFGKEKMLIDAFHSEKYDIYSSVSPDLFEEVLANEAFADPDIMFFTHRHPDHFSAEMTAKAVQLWPETTVILPENTKASPERPENKALTADALHSSGLGNVRFLSERKEEFRLGDLSLCFVRLPHENEIYSDVPHYGMFAEVNGITVFDPADCEIAAEELIDLTYGRKINVAILNFPWITLRRGRDFVKKILQPEHIVICHLPDPAMDELGYMKAAENAVRRNFEGVDVRLLQKPLKCESITCI